MQNTPNIKRDPYVHHDLVRPTSAKLELNIMVGSVNLSLGRTITEKDETKMENNIHMFEYLDQKVVLEAMRDPRFGWSTLAQWRSWASGFVTEFIDKMQEEQAEQAEDERDKIAGNRIADGLYTYD